MDVLPVYYFKAVSVWDYYQYLCVEGAVEKKKQVQKQNHKKKCWKVILTHTANCVRVCTHFLQTLLINL